MARAVTLFTGQWADLPLEKLAKKATSWGYDGLELVPLLKSECNILYLLSFRPKARLCRAEAEESVECASPKANQKVKLIYWKRH